MAHPVAIVACHRGFQHMRSRLALLVIPGLLLAMLPGSVSAAPGASSADAAAARERARVMAYWTPQRMANAKPRDFVFDPVRGYTPAAKPPGTGGPGGGGGGGGTTTIVTGKSYTSTNAAVYRITGRALFTIGGGDYICSGAAVADTSNATSTILTAGHCTMENDGSTWATNWMFIPEFDAAPTYSCASTKHGCWVATALYGDSEFLNAGGFNNQAVAHDWAFAVVGAGGKNGTTQLDSLGSFGIQFAGPAKGTTLAAFGYPAAGKYRGNDLVYCQGPIGEDANSANLTWSMGCDMTGGSSGGPWLSGDYTGTGAALRSLNSYGYSGIKNMYGPKFNAETQDAYNAANSGSMPGGVVRTTVLGNGY
jgi:V8-like Glu-specific endopeptidase